MENLSSVENSKFLHGGGLQANRLQNFSLVENKFDFSTTFTLVCRGPNILSEYRRGMQLIDEVR